MPGFPGTTCINLTNGIFECIAKGVIVEGLDYPLVKPALYAHISISIFHWEGPGLLQGAQRQ